MGVGAMWVTQGPSRPLATGSSSAGSYSGPAGLEPWLILCQVCSCHEEAFLFQIQMHRSLQMGWSLSGSTTSRVCQQPSVLGAVQEQVEHDSSSGFRRGDSTNLMGKPKQSDDARC